VLSEAPYKAGYSADGGLVQNIFAKQSWAIRFYLVCILVFSYFLKQFITRYWNYTSTKLKNWLAVYTS